jgi:sulfoxide reductase heme-binding subunit YedZ
MTAHLFWITSRAAGTAALLFSSAAVCVGLAMGGAFVRRRGADLRVTHEALSLATLAALAVHAVVLLGDRFMHPSLADVTVPLVSSFQRGWTTMGIVGGWMVVLLGLSYYARATIGVSRWRTLHRFTALAWLLGAVHAIGEGTDAGRPWFYLPVVIAIVPAAVLLIARLGGVRAQVAA